MTLQDYARKNKVRNRFTLLTLHESLHGAARRAAWKKNLREYAEIYAGDSAFARAFRKKDKLRQKRTKRQEDRCRR
jgi:hypothetical protein